MGLFSRIADTEKNSAVVRVQSCASQIFGAEASETIAIVRQFNAELKSAKSATEINTITARYLANMETLQ